MTDAVAASQHGLLQRDVVTITHVSNGADRRALERHLDQHHDYVAGVEARSGLFLAGPLLTAAGDLTGSSLWIVDTPSLDAAQELAAGDPYVRSGIRSVELQRWRINIGSIDVRLTCSNQSFTLGE